MKTNKGFTLTEILLAVMLVGIIGVALASLTTAASRESGVGSSRVMLRNNASLALRQLRNDVHHASRVLFVKGVLSSTLGNTDQEPLLVLANNLSLVGGRIDNDAQPEFIAYCFLRGNTTATSAGDAVQPSGSSYDEGVITREVWASDTTIPTASTACASDKTGRTVQNWLQHIKFISSSYTYGDPAKSYPVPLFSLVDFNGNMYNDQTSESNGAILDVKIILELPSYPVVNEAVEERILLSNGGKTGSAS